jgi:hypothetical protein
MVSARINRSWVLREANEAALAYLNYSVLMEVSLRQIHLKRLLESIAILTEVHRHASDIRIDDEAAHLAGWEAQNFTLKLTSVVDQPCSLMAAMNELAVARPTIDQILAFRKT